MCRLNEPTNLAGIGCPPGKASRTPDVRNYPPPKQRKRSRLPKKPRRAGRRKQARGPQITSVPGQQFYTDAERVRLKFSDSYMLVQGASAGTLSRLAYKVNSLFQVNFTASAGTPQGVASLTAKYQRYIVHGSRIHWRLRGLTPGFNAGSLGVLGSAPTHSMMVSACLFPAQFGATLPTTIQGCAIQKYATPRFEWPLDVNSTSPDADTAQINPRTVWQGTKSMSVKKLDADPDVRQVEYTAAFGADPTRVLLWVFSFQDVLADTTGEKSWFVEVDVDYDIYAFDRVIVGDTLLGDPTRTVKTLSGQPSVECPPESPVMVHKPESKTERKELKVPAPVAVLRGR